MRAYSYDLRQRILRAADQGKSRAEIIKTFDVSRATIKRYLKLRRETGDIKPKAIPGREREERSGPACGAQTPTRCLPRCNTCRTLSHLGNDPGHSGESSNHEPCDPPAGLDPEEKDVTRERTKGSRSRSLARTGSNIRCEQADLPR